MGLVSSLAESAAEDEAREDRGAEGDAEEDGDAGGDDGIADVDIAAVADDLDVENCQGRKQHDLQHGIKRHQHGAVIRISASQVGPDEDHGYAARDADEDEPFAQRGLVGQESPCEAEHEEGTEDPV